MWIQPLTGVKATQTSPAQPPMAPPATEKQNIQNKEAKPTSEPVGYVTAGSVPTVYVFLLCTNITYKKVKSNE